MPTENRSSKTAASLKRKGRYIVIKRSDLANVPANYRSAMVDPTVERQMAGLAAMWPVIST